MTRRFELPTWTVVFAIYGGWIGLTLAANRLPWPLVLLLGAWLVAWQGSLQHETIHDHPARSRWLNALVGFWPLSLWLPYGIYRAEHLRHHDDARLTDPLEDPESYYVTADRWRELGVARRALLRFHQTLVGRLVIGPPLSVARLLSSEAARLARGDRRNLRHWVLHLVGVAAVIGWLHFVCALSLGKYLLLFVYPGLSLTLLRAFVEHRPAREHAHRTAIVESGALFSLLFLNNNLHAVHHRLPAAPWYELPGLYRAAREALLAANEGYRFDGYGEIARRFALTPRDEPVWPLAARDEQAP
ncbi:MAG: fatty acid desaturase [Myxococcales bacterium]|nr:fatty acid desaturase [Myxococcales bacterium]